MLLAAALYVVHMDGTLSFPEICHDTGLGHSAAVGTPGGEKEHKAQKMHQIQFKYFGKLGDKLNSFD